MTAEQLAKVNNPYKENHIDQHYEVFEDGFIAGYNADRWIDVKERLPEGKDYVDSYVRIFVDGQEEHGYYEIPTDKRRKPYWVQKNDEYTGCVYPTHWQPIFPPKQWDVSS
jgi:Protein of unknown function (DUF551)